jgi:hypothetical protein
MGGSVCVAVVVLEGVARIGSHEIWGSIHGVLRTIQPSCVPPLGSGSVDDTGFPA